MRHFKTLLFFSLLWPSLGFSAQPAPNYGMIKDEHLAITHIFNSVETLPLTYSTFFGGTRWSSIYGVAVDKEGNVYVTGNTASQGSFPLTPRSLQNRYGGDEVAPYTYGGPGDAFVSKFDPHGGLIYSTYLGGSGGDAGSDIATDAAGNAYVIGKTASPDFPVTLNAFQKNAPGGWNAFVAKLDGKGQLIFSSFFGGAADDVGESIAVDEKGMVFIVGQSDFPGKGQNPSNFPLKNASLNEFYFRQPWYGCEDPGGGERSFDNRNNGFIAKLDPAQSGESSLIFSTYFGGLGSDYIEDVATDSRGAVYVVGRTYSPSLPPNGTPIASNINNACSQNTDAKGDVFVSKLSSSGAPIYTTALGGDANDRGFGLFVDPSGSAYVVGDTQSSSLCARQIYGKEPGTGNAVAFIARLKPDGSVDASYGTCLGAGMLSGIFVDPAGSAFVVGSSLSTEFPVTSKAIQQESGGASKNDVIFAKLSPNGQSLLYSTYFGGDDDDAGYAVALSASGQAYIAGETESPNLKVTEAAVQKEMMGGTTGLLARMGGSEEPPVDGDAAKEGDATDTTKNKLSTEDKSGEDAYGSDDLYGTKISPSGKGGMKQAEETDSAPSNGGCSCNLEASPEQLNDLDPSFNGKGYVVTNWGGKIETATSLVITPPDKDSKIIVGGYSDAKGLMEPELKRNFFDIALARYQADGTLDLGFGGTSTGYVLTNLQFPDHPDDKGKDDDSALAMALDPAGRIVVGGSRFFKEVYPHYLITQWALDGKPYVGANPVPLVDGEGVPLINSKTGKPLVDRNGQPLKGHLEMKKEEVWNEDFAVVRYTPNGILDDTFGALTLKGTKSGWVHTNFSSGLNKNGDTGSYTLPFSHDRILSLVLQPMEQDYKILGAGYTSLGYKDSNQFGLVQYKSDGGVDQGEFGRDGKLTFEITGGRDNVATAVGTHTSGNIYKIYVAGYVWNDAKENFDFGLARFNMNGTDDQSFGGEGINWVTTDLGGDDRPMAIKIQPDGKVLVAGYTSKGSGYDFVVVRYDQEGKPDPGFGSGGVVTIDFGGHDYGQALALQPDGKFVIAGDSYYEGNFDVAVARYLSDGTPDESLGDKGRMILDIEGAEDHASAVAVQSDGKIVVAGSSGPKEGQNILVARFLAARPTGKGEGALRERREKVFPEKEASDAGGAASAKGQEESSRPEEKAKDRTDEGGCSLIRDRGLKNDE